MKSMMKNMMKKLQVLMLLLISVSMAQAADAPIKLKYGPKTTPLSQDHAYLQKNPAPDYWAVSPYYVSQVHGNFCAVAAYSAAFNALRSFKKLTADDKLITQDAMVDKVDHEGWNRQFKQKGKTASLNEYGEIAKKALKIYDISGKTAEVLHVDSIDAKTTAKVRDILLKNEKSAQDVVLVNALQSELTGDPEGAVGHVVVVGAYDKNKNRVLVMDPDREYYEPYWVDLAMLMKGMNTLDKDANANRGLVWIH